MLAVGEDFSITITRGDTATLEFVFTGDVPTENDSVIAAVKRSKNCSTPEISKTFLYQGENVWSFSLVSEDTENLQFGTYWWDLRILYADGQVTTPITSAPFIVSEVVTDLPEAGDDGD